MSDIKLIALDLDGTLFNNDGIITEANREAIEYAASKGVYVVISTGRPFSGLPFKQIAGMPIDYAITTNGAAAYRIHDRKCLFETTMPEELVLSLIRYFLPRDIHITAFAGGEGYTPTCCYSLVNRLIVPPSVKETYFATRRYVPDLCDYILTSKSKVQKITLNFIPDANGVLKNRREVEAYLKSLPELAVVCGGYQNLEMTLTGITKGNGLKQLAEILGLQISQTMAIGDAGNDLSIIQDAGIGVCMANGEPDCLAAADFITASNQEDGVAKAIYKFV